MSKLYWCSKCKFTLEKKQRRQRAGTRGWVCPVCGTGLPRYPIEIIDEHPELHEMLGP